MGMGEGRVCRSRHGGGGDVAACDKYMRRAEWKVQVDHNSAIDTEITVAAEVVMLRLQFGSYYLAVTEEKEHGVPCGCAPVRGEPAES